MAESFGDLDPKIDGREEVVEEGMKFTGYHRLEKDLWVGRPPARHARRSPTSCSPTSPRSSSKAKAVELNPLQLANGSKALLDEVATGKITGEEERYCHTDLWDFEANLAGLPGRASPRCAPSSRSVDPALVGDARRSGSPRSTTLLETAPRR